jgi:hypothetical protein
MRIVIATLVVALTAVPCLAQNSKLGKQPKQEAPSQAAKNAEKKEEGDYRSAIGRLPDKQFDPWRNMR